MNFSQVFLGTFILLCYSNCVSIKADYGYSTYSGSHSYEYGPFDDGYKPGPPPKEFYGVSSPKEFYVVSPPKEFPRVSSPKEWYGVSSPLIVELRGKIKKLGLDSYYTSDRQLARYIESSKLNVDRAAGLLTRTSLWRQKTGADALLDSPLPAIIVKSFPYECTGYTDEGLPVIYLPIGKWDYAAVREAGLGKEIYKYFRRLLENIRRSVIHRKNPKTGQPVDQVVIIENLQGSKLSNSVTIRNNNIITIIRYLLNIDRHYPFLAKKYIVLNSPLTTQAAWKVIRKFTPRLRKILVLYNRLSETGSKDLSLTVPKRAIPVELGGSYISVVSHKY